MLNFFKHLKQMKSSKLLQLVFDHTKPRYTSFQFTEMINIGLVLAGVKKGALLYLDPYAVGLLRKEGLYVEAYPLWKKPNLMFVAKKDPKWSKDVSHKDVGRALGYLTPVDIEDDSLASFGARIEITFRRNKGRVLKAYEMTQKIVGKTKREARAYLEPFVEAIQTMELPQEFQIQSVEIILD